MAAPLAVEAHQLPLPFGRFVLQRLLGEGGMGRVFAAELVGPGGFKKAVALKVVHARGDGDDLLREARLGAMLRHRHLVEVYDCGVTDAVPWIAMERVDGITLEALLRAVPELPPPAALELADAVLQALQHAHELEVDGRSAGLVHRDLKPGNILLARDGTPKVSDLGLARGAADVSRTAEGVARGTPAYMSPEQAEAGALDGRTDLFSLGLVVYEALTGARFLAGASVLEILMGLVRLADRLGDPATLGPLDGVAPGLGAWVSGCLAPSREQRFADAASARAALLPLRDRVGSVPTLGDVVRAVLEGRALPRPRADATIGLSGTGGLPHRTNLPVDRPALLGRDEALQQIGETVRGGARLVTLVGPGGTGKTSLAIEAARRLLGDFPGGAWFVGLEEARTLAGIVASIGAALDVPLPTGAAAEVARDRLLAALQGRQRLLLVLDNWEQVVALSAVSVGRFLAEADAIVMLVTSREPLRLRGETILDLPPLSHEAAVALFYRRAEEAGARAIDGDEDRAAVEEIVRQLDGLPLAVELAAARAAVLPPRALRERLADRFRLLRSRQRDAHSRQATLEGAIAWSWDLLADDERAVLSAVSVFRGGAPPEVLERFIDALSLPSRPFALDVLESLRDKSLLRSVPPKDGLDGRFVPWETVRAFAEEKLAADPRLGAAARDAHAEALLRHVESLTAPLASPREELTMRRLRGEFDNLLAIRERYAGTRPEWAARAALSCEKTLRHAGPYELAVRMLLDPLDGSQLSPRVAVDWYLARSWVHRLDGARARSDAEIDDAERIAREAGDSLLLARALRNRAYTMHDSRGADTVIAGCVQAVDIFRKAGDRAEEAVALSALAMAKGYAGLLDEAESLHRQAKAVHAEVGHVRMVAADATNIGVYAALRGAPDEAERAWREALAQFRAVSARQGECVVLGNLAALRLEAGAVSEAQPAFRRALRMAKEIGDRRNAAMLAFNIASCALLAAEPDAEPMLRDAAAQALELGDIHQQGRAHRALGWLAHLGGRLEEAGEHYAAARAALLDAQVFRDLDFLSAGDAALLADRGVEDGARALLDAPPPGGPRRADLALAFQIVEGHLDLLRVRQARARGDADAAGFHLQIAEARLDAGGGDLVPEAAAIARRLLASALAREG